MHYATGAFLDALVKVTNWQTRPLTEAVQAVQISAIPEGYARHEPEAQALADALTGKTPAGISCSFRAPTQVASTKAIAASVTDDLPVNSPTTTDRTVSVPGASWATAAWFVANADRLGIERLRYAARTWKRGHGWTKSHAPSDAVVATCTRPEPRTGNPARQWSRIPAAAGRRSDPGPCRPCRPSTAPPGEPSSSKKSTLAWV